MASFSDYYKAELSKRAVSAPHAVKPGPTSGSNSSSDQNPILGGIQRFFDILSRPLYGVEGALDAAVNTGARAAQKLASGDVGGAVGDAVSNSLLNPFGGESSNAFRKGVWSDQPDAKKTTSGLIEKIADTAGKATDPNYVDTPDNVNPWVKGIGGFAGDVALDPLTWIPGAQLLKGAKYVVGGADKVLTAGSKALSGEKVLTKAEKAAQAEMQAVKDAAAAAKSDKKASKLASSIRSTADQNANPFEGFASTLRPSPATKISADLAKMPEFITPQAVPTSGKVFETGVPQRLALDAPEVQAAKLPSSGQVAADVAPESVPLSRDLHPALPSDILDANGAIKMTGPSLEKLVARSPHKAGIATALNKVADVIDASRSPKPFSVPDFLKANEAHPLRVELPGDNGMSNHTLGQLVQIASGPLSKTPRGKLAGEAVNMALKQAANVHKAASAAPLDALAAFQNTARADETSMRNAIGEDLFNYLSKPGHSPKKFSKMLQSMKSVIEPGQPVADTLRNMDQNLSKFLSERLGLPKRSAPHTEEEAAALADSLLSSNEPYTHAVAQGLANALGAELKDLKAKGFLYATKQGVLRTSKTPGEGLGRYADQLNGFSQYTFLKHQAQAIDLAAQDVMRARSIRGNSFRDLYSMQRTQVYREAVMRVLKDQAQILDDIGVHAGIGVGDTTKMLSTYEVYRAIQDSADTLGLARTAEQGLFNYGTAAAPTAITDAAAAAIDGASYDEILAILTDPKKYGNKGLIPGAQGVRPNNLIDQGHGWGSLSYSQLASVARETGESNDVIKAMIRKKEAGRASSKTGETRVKTHYWLSYKTKGRNLMAESLAKTIEDAAPALKLRAAENEMAFVNRTRQEVHKLSTDELQRIDALIREPSGTILKARAYKAQMNQLNAEAAAINASPDAVKAAKATVDAATGDVGAMLDASSSVDPAYRSASTAVELKQANTALTHDTMDVVEGELEGLPTTTPVGSQDIVDADVIGESAPLFGDFRDMLYNEGLDFVDPAATKFKGSGGKPKQGAKRSLDLSQDSRVLVDSFGRQVTDPYGLLKAKIRSWFDMNYGAGKVMPGIHAWQNSAAVRTAFMNHQLNAISKAARSLGQENNIAKAFENVQKGISSSDPALSKVEGMIGDAVKDYFDLDTNGSLGNVFFRVTSQADLVNSTLAAHGIDHIFDLGKAQASHLPLDQALASQWRDWKVKDPLDFLHRLTTAREELVFNRGSMESLQKTMPEMFSMKRQPGFVQVIATNPSKSRFIAHLPTGVWVEKGIAEELRRVEQVYRTSRQFRGELGNFINSTYAPLLNAWKFAITLPRPGHHIRNLIGDTSVTWMRRGNANFTQSWKDAVKILAYRGDYADVNMLEAATRYGIKDLPRTGDVVIDTNSKFGKFTVDELYSALSDGGALPSYHIGEDFLNARGKLDHVMGKVTGRDTRVGEFLGKVSEGRDHLTRFQHFAQILRQDSKKFRGTREQLIQDAVQEVIKYHPDASLLTTMESKLRYVIPFYSWFGKIIPALVESMTMHPGRLSSFNKASFNWAVSNGLDPQSLSDPFPDDQLFPSFITDQALGPQMQGLPLPGNDQQYVRTSPGIAALDVMNTFSGDPIRGVAGMVSPIIRVPAELLSGGSWSTGAKIKDWSDYLDSSLPGVNYVANISGVSPTGSAQTLLSGQGLDPQASMVPNKKGQTSKTAFDQALSMANLISGLGLQDLSRSSYINYAEIEKRNAAQKAQGGP